MLALAVPLLIAVASSWAWIVAANVLLGINQGLAWSMTAVMKIDLVGPRRRGLVLGLTEAAGYGGVSPRDVLVVGGTVVTVLALSSRGSSSSTPRRTSPSSSPSSAAARARPHPRGGKAFAQASWRVPALLACSQAGLVNNLNHALA